ncbi:MAG: hypothetical protein ACFE9Q_00735 [Candidatus Hodarchaeota archaeon]
MEKINEFFDKLFKLIPGYLFGFVAFTVGFLGDSLALLTTPEYIWWRQSISILGDLSGGIFLRTGLIISGLMAIPFFIYLGRAVKDDNVNEVLRKIAIIFSIFSSICVALTGTFSGVNEFIKSLHGFFALCSWLGNTAVFILFSLAMSKNIKFSKYPVRIGYIIGGILIVYLIPFFITNFCNYFREICYAFGQRVFTIMAVFEWVVYFSILFWILYNSSYLLHKKI